MNASANEYSLTTPVFVERLDNTQEKPKKDAEITIRLCLGGYPATPRTDPFTDMAAMVLSIEQPWWGDG